MKRSGMKPRTKPMALGSKRLKRSPMKRWRPAIEGAKWNRAERLAVLERDEHRCRCAGCPSCRPGMVETSDGEVWATCAVRDGLEVDHIRSLGTRVAGGRYNPAHALNARTNKITLCRSCHRRKTYGEDYSRRVVDGKEQER